MYRIKPRRIELFNAILETASLNRSFLQRQNLYEHRFAYTVASIILFYFIEHAETRRMG
jgi:hypothetical protein